LTNAKGERVTPGNNYLDWLVVSLFRQWLADNTSPQPPPERHHGSRSNHNPPAPPPPVPPLTSIGRAYRTLGSANANAYLNHDDCKKSSN
jgi:hypothetical protein